MAVLGYSERGIFNSIVYYLDGKPSETRGFLEQLKISLDADYTNFTFLVEASFSDFGEPDLTVIAENTVGEKVVIFIEGKTITNDNPFSVAKAFQKLKAAIEEYNRDPKNNDHSRTKTGSNLFTQLYYKYELVNSLDNNTSADRMSDVFKKKKGNSRKTGDRQVVKLARNAISSAKHYYYAAVLPNYAEEVTPKIFADYFSKLDDSGINNFVSAEKATIVCGYWEKIDKYFTKIGAETVMENFKHNKGQIYK
jgi:hypothetical protein